MSTTIISRDLTKSLRFTLGSHRSAGYVGLNKFLGFSAAIASIVQNNDRSPGNRCHFRLRRSQEADLPESLNVTSDIHNDTLDLVDFLDDLPRCDSRTSTSRPSRPSTCQSPDSVGDRGRFSIDARGSRIFPAIKNRRELPGISLCGPGSGAIAGFQSKPIYPFNLTVTPPMPDRNCRLVTTFPDPQRGAGACPVADVISTKHRVNSRFRGDRHRS
jgi:hypothetical protein